MSLMFLTPSWFYGYAIALEFLFAVISLVISVFAWRIYKKVNLTRLKLFSISFMSISVAYFIQSIFNFLILSKANQKICSILRLQSIEIFNKLGVLAHVIFMTIGLITLTYMTFKVKRKRIFWLMFILTFFAIFLSQNILYMFFIVSSLYLIFLSWYFVENYLENRQTKALLIAAAFIFLLLSTIHFFLATRHKLFYAIGHILELVAYILILINFYMVSRK